MVLSFNRQRPMLLFSAVVFFLFSCGEEKAPPGAESEEPVTWTFVAEKQQGNAFRVKAVATLKPGWHIYSQSTPAGGPVPTRLHFQPHPLIRLSGDVTEEGKLEQHYEPLFELDVLQFSNKVAFVQDVKVRSGVTTELSGSVRFMACNSRQCLPATELPLSVVLKN